MAVSDGLQTSDEKLEVEKELLGEKPSSDTKSSNDSNKKYRIKGYTKLKVAVVIGFTLSIMAAIAVVVYLAIARSVGDDKPRNCITNLRIPNGKVLNAKGFSEGDTANIECDDGHKLNGSNTILCLSSGHWNETPACLRHRCDKLPLPRHAKVELHHLFHQIEEINVACEKGFLLEGNSTVICHDNETWSKIPNCKPVNCGHPSYIKNGITLNLTDTTYNSMFHVKCNDGYYLKGRGVVKCESDGLWTELPSCKLVPCGTPDIPKNAYISVLGRRSVSFICKNGYVLVGDTTSTCQSYGHWSTYPECKRTCSLNINIPNGRVINTAGLNYSHIAKIECADKHKLNGSNTLVCLPSGQWNETPICVRKQCRMFQVPENAQIKPRYVVTRYVGDKVTVSCIKGFYMDGNKKVICHGNETWSPIPICKPVDCGYPPITSNAIISTLTSTTYNTIFYTKCKTGYNLKSNSLVRCEAGGYWNRLPKCIPVSCGTPRIPNNAYRQTYTGVVFGSVVSFQCKTGFIMTGVQSSTCQSDGKWSEPYPTCEQIKEQKPVPKKKEQKPVPKKKEQKPVPKKKEQKPVPKKKEQNPVPKKKDTRFVRTRVSSSSRLFSNIWSINVVLFVTVLIKWFTVQT